MTAKQERLILRLVSFGAYAVCAAGCAVQIGGAWGWAVGTLAAALPGGYLLARSADDRSVASDIKARAPEQFQAPAGAPESLHL